MATIEVKNEYMIGRQNENILYYKCMELQQENKQLKEELENLKDAFDFNLGAIENIRKENHKLEDTIDNAKEYIKNILKWVRLQKDWETEKILLNLLILLGDKE